MLDIDDGKKTKHKKQNKKKLKLIMYLSSGEEREKNN